MRAWVSSAGDSGFTSSPVSPFFMISGMPPTLLATIGRPVIMASRFTKPKASRLEGRTKISEARNNCGVFFILPRSMTWDSILSFLTKLSRFCLSFPSPIIANFIFGYFVTILGIAFTKYFKPLRSWSSAIVLMMSVLSLARNVFSLISMR